MIAVACDHTHMIRCVRSHAKGANDMTATRTLNGTDIPVAGVWSIDPGHAEVGFTGRHFGLTKIRGRFT
jgi:polyisoprenoid-binding protein YceI